MVFNSVEFIAFFLLVLGVYWALPQRARNFLLLPAGYLFYGWWNWKFLGLLLFSTLMDYWLARRISRLPDKAPRRKWLIISVAANLAFLGFFKYFNFFAESLHDALRLLGMQMPIEHLNVILPIGLSFYTFQSMGYVIDTYRGARPARNLFEYANYVAFFPVLVAGPIERAAHMLPQFNAPKFFSYSSFVSGLELMAWGFFKKMFIADNVSAIADHVFSTPVADQSGLQCLLGVYAFAIQIYCDFSGYSDIARGTARCLGFELMMNFRCPYMATNPQEFWGRWHISLSTWLRDYLYVPLGGNRGGTWRTYRNLMITMLLGGLWHGAKWPMIVWGAYHGLILIIHRAWSSWRGPARLPGGPAGACLKAIRIVCFFHVVCLGWLFFRADTMTQAWDMLTRMFADPRLGTAGIEFIRLIAFLVWFLLVAEIIWYVRERPHGQPDEIPVLSRRQTVRAALAGFAISSVLLFGAFDARSFIYFQF